MRFEAARQLLGTARAASTALLLLTAIVAVGATPALVVLQARAPASLPGTLMGVVYMTIHNVGAVPDRLLGASTPLAAKVELHSTQMQDGMARMRPSPGIDLPVGGSIELSTGGTHLMLMGLVRPLKVGDVVSLTLKFQRAGEIKTEVPVTAPR